MEYLVHLRKPHPKQQDFISSSAKRKVIRAGRRGGKTTGIAIYAVAQFLAGKRVLYATPTADQINKFWWEVTKALRDPLAAKVFYKNETEHVIEVKGTENRIRAKTAWNANTLRGDYADRLILDEFQLMTEDTWEDVGAPMLIDHDGDAVFIFTPPSLRSIAKSHAKDPRYASKLFQKALKDETERWAAFHFSSFDNPYTSRQALEEISTDMSALSYRQEILAEDIDEAPGALWTRDIIERNRIPKAPHLTRIVVGVDPPGGATECGIVVAGIDGKGHGYVIDDRSLQASPERWAAQVVAAYNEHQANLIVVEKNFGGDMVKNTIRSVEGGQSVTIKEVTASRGKAIRAEPVSAKYERDMVHHVGSFPRLEDEMCLWQPNVSTSSPNRIDGLVWTCTELLVSGQPVRSASW